LTHEFGLADRSTDGADLFGAGARD
jgi:hypothetical protein